MSDSVRWEQLLMDALHDTPYEAQRHAIMKAQELGMTDAAIERAFGIVLQEKDRKTGKG